MSFILLSGLALGYSCQKLDLYNGADSMLGDIYTDLQGPLKSLTDIPIGFAIDYTMMRDNTNYRNTVSTEGGSVTLANEMKHRWIVQDDGTLDFTRADELLGISKEAGLTVFGHTLVWHQNQNAAYLRGVAGGGGGSAVNLLENGSFEEGDGNDFTGWEKWNGAANITATTVESERNHGTRGAKVANTTGGGEWTVQFVSPAVPTTVGKTYHLTFWIRTESGSAGMRVSTTPNAQYSQNWTIGTEWQQITWIITANAENGLTRFAFDMGNNPTSSGVAATFLLDDVRVIDPDTPGSGDGGGDAAERVDDVMKTFIQGMVDHYKNDVKAWDVVNEPLNDNGSLRAGPYDPDRDASDVFYWGEYLGADYIKNAFNYAHEADPEALLFINDYNLESSPTKVDALIALVEALRAEGVPIHGIGTQMHCGTNTSFANIDAMFKKLAATGLQIRISELDVRLNPGNGKSNTYPVAASPTLLNIQAHMYYYVISSYLKHVPAAQRHGITVWGVTDEDSWIVQHQSNNDAPLLYDKDFNKKPAYGGVVKALKETR